MGSHPLLALPDSEFAVYYENVVLGAQSVEVKRLGAAYRRLSDELNAGEPRATGDLRDGDAMRTVWQLVYGLRTALVARRLVRDYPPPPGEFVELGAGTGPFGLIASAMGRAVTLVDISREALREATTFYRRFDLPPPKTLVADASRRAPPEGTLALPYVASEWATTQSLGGMLKDRWGYVVEHGTKRGGHLIQALRDQLAGQVTAPCPRRDRCSLHERPNDWCHFTWGMSPGPVTKQVAATAGRHSEKMHVSFLVIGLGASHETRVLSVRSLGKQKAIADLCTAQGLERFTVLKRHRAAHAHLLGIEPGSPVRLDRSRCVAKGDGLRIEDEGAVRLIPESQRST